jgi:hypothetical protein
MSPSPDQPNATTLPADPREAAELYCLGECDSSQLREVEARLKRGDDALATEIASLRALTDALLSAPAPIAPDPRVRAGLERFLAEDATRDRPEAIALRAGAAHRASASTTGARSWSIGRIAPWLLAAASITLAVFAWTTRSTPTTPTIPTPPIVVAPPSPSEQLASLRAAPGTQVWTVGAQGEWQSKGAGVGELVWNSSEQRGFLRVKALNANDPGKEQYQAWLFDAKRGKEAVSGGVFDAPAPVDADGYRIVPIRPDLTVGDLTTFAVTIERPGGVVVTDASRLVLLATAPGGAG